MQAKRDTYPLYQLTHNEKGVALAATKIDRERAWEIVNNRGKAGETFDKVQKIVKINGVRVSLKWDPAKRRWTNDIPEDF